MIKVKDGYGKLIGTTYQGSATQVLLSNGGNLELSSETKANTLVQRNASQHIYATYFNSAISDEALTDIGSVYVRNTSDTFIRRISKTQFYSIIDNKFVTLDTAQTITGVKTFSTGPILANNAIITQNQNSTSNYTTVVRWLKGGTSQGTYNPSIGQHNTGGDGTGSICILPYPTSTDPLGGTVGLFIGKGVLRLDGKAVAIAENYYTKTESDERYVNVTGDTMTGPLIVKASITGTQLISNIADGTAPLKVTSKTVVTNLNSDLLDGYHETSFFRARGSQTIASSIPTTTELSSNNNLSGNWNVTYPGASGHLVQFNTGSGSTRYMQFYSYYSGSLYWRNSTDSTLNTKSWKTIVDSANYTGIVLKIGTATKGSATLPIYLNAGTPTACSTTLGVSITGNAATANRIISHSISDTLANKTTPGYLYHAGESNSVKDKPSGVDAFGVFTMQTASGWYGQLLMSSNTSTGLYWRTATSLNGGWKKILDSSNYTAYVNPANFVTSLGTNGNYVTWTKNGTTNNLTVPFATTSNVLNNLGNRTAISGTTVGQRGLRLYEVYNNGYPVNFGNVLNIGGQGYGELLFQWTGDSNPGHLYYRSKRDVASQAWSNWVTILDNNNYSSTLDGRYVTLATNQTVSGIKTFSTQQKFTVATGTSPFTVSSTTVVSNLNADMLDGWHLNYILKDGFVTSATSGLSSYWRKVWDITLNNQYNDVDINLLVHSAYNQQWGIISFKLRQNGTGTAKNISAYLAEVVGNIPLDRFRLYYNNSSGLCQLWCNPSGQYNVYNYRVLAKTWRTGTEVATLGTFYTGDTSTAQSLPSDSYVSMAGITIVNTAAKVANTLTFSAGKFSSKTYNGSSAITVNVPTHTSHLTNDSGFWTGTRYWANIAVSTSSSTSTSPTFSTAYTSNWFRSTGSTGWYSQTYGGGWYMSDSTWIRTYGSKSVYQDTGQIRTDGYLVTNGGLTAGATSPNNGTYKLHVTGASWSSGLIRAGGGFYHNSVNSNSYVLLAGGSYKGLGDFAKGNAGSATKGVYVTGGTVTAMTYSLSSNLNSGTSGKLAYYSSATTVAAYSSSVGASNRGVYMNAGVPTVMAYYLNATVNSGASGKLAYYSGTNSIDDYTSTVGSSGTPIYLSSGVPTACTGVMVKYWASYTINNYSGTSVTYSKNGGNYNFVTSTSRRDTGRYTIGTVYPSGQTWYTTLVWAVGNLNASNSSNSSNSLLYCTLIRGYNSGSTYYWYVNTADDSSTNNGSFGLFFLCF